MSFKNIKFSFFNEQRELDVQDLLKQASQSEEDYLIVIGKVESAIKEKRKQNNEDKSFMQKIHKVIVGLRLLVWPTSENSEILRGQVDLTKLDSILDNLKGSSFRIANTKTTTVDTPDNKKSQQ